MSTSRILVAERFTDERGGPFSRVTVEISPEFNFRDPVHLAELTRQIRSAHDLFSEPEAKQCPAKSSRSANPSE
jgi:hypothetical protein